ncbi:hypothetical protein D9M68_114440 [compost metagenome]|uniref:Lipoprotein n=1 Tax=Pseudomonas jinjuensis TaxID=198616 RepID=A0A1H0BUU0_9PSED|nr:hypothetical protein [Pseudomonas jinjuensis]SDN49373.1 hypothetical protein SAMN05216193_103203 [Pseudomonas jinjuensis]
MTKFLSLVLLSVMTGCTAQPQTGFVANWHNTCGHPIEITARDFSNSGESSTLSTVVAPGESIQVLSIVSFGTNLHNSIPRSYSLDLKANGRTLHIGKVDLLGALQKSKETPLGNAIRLWTLSDAMACP